MNDFKKDFEIRRVIFGLTAIIKTPAAEMPAIVAEKLPAVMNQLALLTQKMHSLRTGVLKENEALVAKGGDFSDEDDDDDDDIGNEANGDDFVDVEAADSDEEWENQNALFAKLGSKLQTGKKLSQEEMKEMGIDDEDDSDDEDYEYNGGDMNLYDSRIDDVDEIKTLKDCLGLVDQELCGRLLEGVDAATRKNFEDILNGIDALTAQEAQVRA